jgi:hypothetical protein
MSHSTVSPDVARPRPWIARILWVDGLAGLAAGVLVLGLRHWLTALYGLPQRLVAVIGVANLVYGTCGLTLALWRRRRRAFVVTMAIANGSWAVGCVWLAIRFAHGATALGIATLLFEAAFVAALAVAEWRNRDALAATE